MTAAARWLPRYEDGEHDAVWTELAELGSDVRRAMYWTDAVQVATATMTRARFNVEQLIALLPGRKAPFGHRPRPISTSESAASR